MNKDIKLFFQSSLFFVCFALVIYAIALLPRDSKLRFVIVGLWIAVTAFVCIRAEKQQKKDDLSSYMISSFETVFNGETCVIEAGKEFNGRVVKYLFYNPDIETFLVYYGDGLYDKIRRSNIYVIESGDTKNETDSGE